MAKSISAMKWFWRMVIVIYVASTSSNAMVPPKYKPIEQEEEHLHKKEEIGVPYREAGGTFFYKMTPKELKRVLVGCLCSSYVVHSDDRFVRRSVCFDEEDNEGCNIRCTPENIRTSDADKHVIPTDKTGWVHLGQFYQDFEQPDIKHFNMAKPLQLPPSAVKYKLIDDPDRRFDTRLRNLFRSSRN